MTPSRIVVFTLILLIAACQSAKESVEQITPPEFVNLFDADMQKGVSCYRIPSIVTAPNGDLIVAIDERIPSCGDLKWSNDINIVVRRSLDNGNSWTNIERVVDFSFGLSASDPSMIVDKITGEIFMFYNYMDLENEKDVYYLHYVKSSDNGQSWSSPVDITDQISKPEWHSDFKFITSGGGIQTSTGTLLHTIVNLDNGMHLFGSDDHGRSWYLVDTPITPANESKVVQLADGRWMVNSRVNEQKLRYVHISDDNGKSWESRPENSLIDPNCNASILRYSRNDKDLLLFSNANNDSSRVNMTLRYSDDQGISWSKGRSVYAGASAYSSMTILDNGDIGLVFEKDDYKENVFVRLTLDWILDTKQ